MSYYQDRDGLRCDRCLRKTTEYLKGPNNADLCDDCWTHWIEDRRTFWLTVALMTCMLGGVLWVLWALPRTPFDS